MKGATVARSCSQLVGEQLAAHDRDSSFPLITFAKSTPTKRSFGSPSNSKSRTNRISLRLCKRFCEPETFSEFRSGDAIGCRRKSSTQIASSIGPGAEVHESADVDGVAN